MMKKRQRDDDCADGLIEPEMRAVEHAVEDEQDAVKDQIAVVDLLQLPVVEAEQKQERETLQRRIVCSAGAVLRLSSAQRMATTVSKKWQGFWDRRATMAAVSATEKNSRGSVRDKAARLLGHSGDSESDRSARGFSGDARRSRE